MKKLFLLLYVLISAATFGQRFTSNQGSAGTAPDKLALWDAICNHAEVDFGHSVLSNSANTGGGVFTSSALTTQCVNGDNAIAFRAFGQNKPSPANMVFKGTTSWTATNALLWWKDYGNTGILYPKVIDRGDFERYVRVFNGGLNTSYWETDPGSFTARTHPIDFILAFRWIPHISDEGTNRVKSLGSNQINALDGWSPSITTPVNINYIPYTDNILRVLVRSDNTYQIWVNGRSVAQGTGINFSTTEWIWGTGSHVLQSHLRYNLVKFGEFSQSAIDLIYANSQKIWPWGLPKYPFITNQYIGDATTFNSTTKAWKLGRNKQVRFTGGNGVAGQHLYIWYYFDNTDNTLFPNADGVLTNHRQIPGSLSVAPITSGNSVSQISIDGFDLMSSPVSFTTDVATTANAIVSNINAAQTKFLAQHRAGGVILFHPQGIGCNNYATNTITYSVSGFTPTLIPFPRGDELTRTDYTGTGLIWDGTAGNSSMRVSRITFPFDSNGVPGEPIPSQWILDNIP